MGNEKRRGKMDDSYYHLDWNMSKDNYWTGAWEGRADQDAVTKFLREVSKKAIVQKMYIPPSESNKDFLLGGNASSLGS